MQVTATEAKNRFGFICAQAKRGPVTVLKDGVPDTVIISFEQFRSLMAANPQYLSQLKQEFQDTYGKWFG